MLKYLMQFENYSSKLDILENIVVDNETLGFFIENKIQTFNYSFNLSDKLITLYFYDKSEFNFPNTFVLTGLDNNKKYTSNQILQLIDFRKTIYNALQKYSTKEIADKYYLKFDIK